MVSRIRTLLSQLLTGPTGHPAVAPQARPHGPQLSTTFTPNAQESWSYRGQELHYNGQPLSQLFQPKSPDVPLWTALAQGLIAYRDWVESCQVVRARRILVQIEQWQHQIGRALHQQYDSQMTGLTLECDGDDVKVNNVNVSQLLACYQLRPTARARQFLQGVCEKLHLLLERPRDTACPAQLGDRVRRLYHDMSSSLSYEALDPLCLPLPRQSVDRG